MWNVMSNMSVAFVGLGYIGLPTAVVLANSGVKVCGVDVKQENVQQINRGVVPIIEPGLEDGLKKALDSGNFKATTEMPHADAYIVAVPTPFADDYSVDMKYIFSVAESIAPQLKGDELIVLESTSPPLTTRKMAARILELRPDLVGDGNDNPDGKPVLYFAHCPERILPGKAMEELVTNDRIIGGETPKAATLAKEIYRTFCKGELLETDAITAEMAKLTENSFRDVNIAFANELSVICEGLGIDVWELIDLANHHPRVNILQPGPGVGGHCIAVDPWFIVSTDPKNARLIRQAREINDGKPDIVVSKISEASVGNPQGAIAILGLAFKANIDDLRESPAVEIAEKVSSALPNRDILVVEPNIHELSGPLKDLENIKLVSIDEALAEASVIALLVDHDEFKEITLGQLENKVIIDTKGLWRA